MVQDIITVDLGVTFMKHLVYYNQSIRLVCMFCWWHFNVTLS